MPSRPDSAAELSKIFFEISYLYEMKNVPFKPRAYKLAAESVAGLGQDVKNAWRSGGVKALKGLPGIGQSTAEKIDEYFCTGKIRFYEEIKKKFPVDVWGLSRIEGLGPKHIADLYTRLGITDVEELKRAIKKHEIRTIPRWGEKSEIKLAQGLGLLERSSGRLLLGDVLPVAEKIVKTLSQIKGVQRCAYAGSLRRRLETVGDIDLLVTTKTPERVMESFVNLPEVVTVHEKGKTRSSVRLSIGLDADLRVVPDKVYGAALQYFTGDKRHNILLRELALSKGYTLNEYGLFEFKRKKKGRLVVCRTEEEIYSKLGMDTPPPELRSGGEELEAALEHRLPTLLPYGSVKGDLQVQTDWTDGSASIEEMAKAAKAAGLSYIAITDHTKALAFIKGLNDRRVLEQGREIDRLNEKLNGFTILKGTECDILRDGSLDLDNRTLAALDWVGISVHSHFNLPRQEQTKRVIKAMSNPHVHCLFHPTGRLIGKREPIDLDLDEVMAAAKKYRVALEINAYPDRSDLRDVHVHAAVRAGVPLVINTDAHAPQHFGYLPLGEAIARRGWATKKDILNAWPLKKFREHLDKK